ncbi:MAG TPA: hypothetical protein VEF76_00790 [Patescibacteria group bacterium]|nr:hypothetical protein [Patescibacteria group bacterium]
MPALSIADLGDDKLVQSVIATLSAGDEYPVDLAELRDHPVLKLFEETGALDGRIGAIIIADEMLRHRGPQEKTSLIAQLPQGVGAIVTLLQGDFEGPNEGLLALLSSNDLAAVKLAAAALTVAGSGEEFEQAKQWASADDLATMGREMTDLAVEIIEAGTGSQLFRDVEPALVEKFVEAVNTLADLAGGTTRRKLVDNALKSLRAEMATAGIFLAEPAAVASAAPATDPEVVASLTRDEILSDAIVLRTLKGLGAGVISDSDIDDLDTLPIINLLIDTDSLDSVSAAVLLVDEATRGHSARDLSKLLPAAVADVVNTLHADEVAFGGPAALLESKNPAVQKVAFAAITAGITGQEFKTAIAAMDDSERKRMVGEMSNAGIQLIEQLTETDGWKTLSPKLLDHFTNGMSDLAELAGTRTQKRLIQTAIQMLKEDIAGGTAAEITQPKPGLPQNLPPPPKLKRGPGGLNV